MCNTLNIKALELYCNIKKWNIELDTLIIFYLDLYAPVGRWDLHGFTLVCGLSADFSCYRQSSAVQAQIQSERNPISSGNVRLNEIREKIKSVASACYPWILWARADWAEGEGAQQCGTVFQTALFSSVINPETSSRVTLASLGTVF